MFGFTEEQIRRYSRQIILPQVGGTGQRNLSILTGGIEAHCKGEHAVCGEVIARVYEKDLSL